MFHEILESFGKTCTNPKPFRLTRKIEQYKIIPNFAIRTRPKAYKAIKEAEKILEEYLKNNEL